MKTRILVSNIMMLGEPERFRQELSSRGWDPVFAQVEQYLDEEQCLELAGNFDVWLAGDDQITRRVLEAHRPRLKGISKWGTGLDSIDLAAAEELGVRVLNTPAAFSDAVGEVALGYMLMLTRHLLQVDQSVRRGSWPKPRGKGLSGRRCGIIGYGAIGQGIARRARAFGMSVFAYDPFQDFGDADPSAVSVDLDELVKQCDVICLACNLTPESRHIINRDRLGIMKPEAIVINVGRGALIDEAALVEALKNGKLSGAGLDVFEVEPLPEKSELRAFPNVILGSHNANNLHSAVEHVHRNTINNIDVILAR